MPGRPAITPRSRVAGVRLGDDRVAPASGRPREHDQLRWVVLLDRCSRLRRHATRAGQRVEARVGPEHLDIYRRPTDCPDHALQLARHPHSVVRDAMVIDPPHRGRAADGHPRATRVLDARSSGRLWATLLREKCRRSHRRPSGPSDVAPCGHVPSEPARQLARRTLEPHRCTPTAAARALSLLSTHEAPPPVGGLRHLEYVRPHPAQEEDQKAELRRCLRRGRQQAGVALLG